MRWKLSLILLLLVIACKKEKNSENNGGANNNGGNNQSAYSGIWNELPLVDSPDYASDLGAMLVTNQKIYALSFNKFSRNRLIAITENGDTNRISTPFDNTQNISNMCMAEYNQGIYVGFNTYLGNTRIYHYVNEGGSWTELPEISVSNYTFNNRIIRATWFKNNLYLAAQSVDSTFVLKYANGQWQILGGKAMGPVSYYLELRSGNNKLVYMSYNPPSGPNPGLSIKSFDGDTWQTEAGFADDIQEELVYPVVDVNSFDDILFGYISYSGSVIAIKSSDKQNWENKLNVSRTDKFYFKPRWDKQHRNRIHTCIISHFAQVTQALWGLSRLNDNVLTEYIVNPDKDNPNYKVQFNPLVFNTFQFETSYNQNLYFLYRENRSPFNTHFVKFKPQ